MRDTGDTMRDTRTPLEKQLGAEMREHAEGECLSFEQMWALTRRGHRASDYHRAMRHIATCTACRRAYLELRAIEHMRRRESLRRVRQLLGQHLAWVPAVGVAVAAVALAWWLWTPRSTQIAQQSPILVRPESPTTLVAPEPKGTPTTPRLADETPRTAKPSTDDPPRNITPIERELASIRRVEPFIREAANAFTALINFDSIRSERQTAQVPSIRILKPDIERNPAIEQTRPLIQWQPIQQAVGYRLQILDENNSRALLEVTLDAARTEYLMPLEATLAQGGKYELIIAALRDGEEPIVLRRRFRVLSEPQRSMWNWAQQHERTHPLLSATVYYYHLDRYTDALRCLRRAQQQNPNDAEINRWLAFVEQRIRQRESEFSR
jgi:tetratricopeptide (TPR) repeat protein